MVTVILDIQDRLINGQTGNIKGTLRQGCRKKFTANLPNLT